MILQRYHLWWKLNISKFFSRVCDIPHVACTYFVQFEKSMQIRYFLGTSHTLSFSKPITHCDIIYTCIQTYRSCFSTFLPGEMIDLMFAVNYSFRSNYQQHTTYLEKKKHNGITNYSQLCFTTLCIYTLLLTNITGVAKPIDLPSFNDNLQKVTRYTQPSHNLTSMIFSNNFMNHPVRRKVLWYVS